MKTQPATTEFSNSVPGAPMEDILLDDALKIRPSRPKDREKERLALASLARVLAASPESVLQKLADSILDALECDSAGVSIVNKDETLFVWPAIAGVWKPYIGGGTPRFFGPCGDVLQRNQPLHMTRVDRRYTYLKPVPLVAEALLVPFYFKGKAVGTIWAVCHEAPDNAASAARQDRCQFDREDLRMLESLGKFAATAYDVIGVRSDGEQ